MLNISVRVTGLDLFPGTQEVQTAIKSSLRQSGQAIKTRGELNLSGRMVRMRSGRLRRGMRIKTQQQGQKFVVTVRNVVFYGSILEAGAAGHVIPGILGRKALEHKVARGEGAGQKTLRFEAGGKVIFARSIVHPGLRPRRWFASAVQEVLPELEGIFERELGAAVTSRSVIYLPGQAA